MSQDRNIGFDRHPVLRGAHGRDHSELHHVRTHSPEMKETHDGRARAEMRDAIKEMRAVIDDLDTVGSGEPTAKV
jgi:hypothetical protein